MPLNLMPDQTAQELSRAPRRFDFNRDSFAFINELVWAYDYDPATGKMIFGQREPKPKFAHRCFAMARVVRQFFYHARFDVEQAAASPGIYRQLVREVTARNPRRYCQPEAQVVIPGFAGLREFSRAHEKLLKAECGGAWRSYFLRSHWRMISPCSRAHQARVAESLVATLGQNYLPMVHIVKFPSLTINHAIVLFDVTETTHGWEFAAYDPNNADQPEHLTFDRATRTFFLPANAYWPSGGLDAIHISRSWFF
jgi:hypothetical protein